MAERCKDISWFAELLLFEETRGPVSSHGGTGLPSRAVPRPVVPRRFRLGFAGEQHTILGSRCGVVGAVGPMIAFGVVSGFSLVSEDRLPGALGVRPCLGWRISHGGMGFGSAHKPRLACCASCSRAPKLTSFEYGRYHQARPARSSSRLTFVPSGNRTSATVRPWRSFRSTRIITSLPWTRVDVNCFAFLPKAWPFSGQSMPLKRMRSGWWLGRSGNTFQQPSASATFEACV
jgi:hypothetical protein